MKKKAITSTLSFAIFATFAVSAVAASGLPTVTQRLINDGGWRPAWALDRINQRSGVDDTYTYTLDGSGVDVYVLDSGINADHQEFDGSIVDGASFVNDGRGIADCSGHGSHSAGVIAGQYYGVAKGANIIPVRILDCNNYGSSMSIYQAVSWILEHHREGQPAVINMSVGMPRSVALNDAVQSLVDDGIVVVAAAGNQGRDACLYSPASAVSAISVGAIAPNDVRANYSNFGACVDVFAPGSDVVAAWYDGIGSYRSTSGTSNAAPVVAGIAAMILQANPTWTPAQVEQEIKGLATTDAISNVGAGSANLLAFSGIESAIVEAPTTTTTVVSESPAPAPSQPSPSQPSTTTTSPQNNEVVQRVTRMTGFEPLIACDKAGMRSRIYAVPYICVNTGSMLAWIPQRYSPKK